MTTIKETVLKKLADRSAKIGIIGLGYVGLPLATAMGEAGFTVLGVDLDQRKIDALNKGISYIQDVPSEQVERLRNTGKLVASTDFATMSDADALTLCV